MNSRITVLAAALLGLSSFASADSIKIAVTGPFSGGSAPMGVSTRDGAKLAIAEINAAGGLKIGAKKFTIEAVERDDEAKNERGALVAQELASMNDVVAVVGTANTGVVLAGDKFYQQAKKPRIIAISSGTAAMGQWLKEPNLIPKGELYIFRFSANDGVQWDLMIDEAVKRQGLKKIAILADDTNYGVSGRDDLMKRFAAMSEVEVVANEKFSIGSKDMSAQLLKAKLAGAQAIFAVGVGPELAAISLGMNKLGIKAPMFGSWSLSMSNFLDNAGASANGAMMPQTFIQEDFTPRAKTFIAAYKAAYKVERIPSPVSAAQGYDAMKVLAAAIEQAGSTDGKAIKDALENLQKPVEGAIAKWVKPYSSWDPAKPESHEAFRKERVVVGLARDGRVTFAHEEDKKRVEQLDR
ncbi:ABC transporter substrate-binding protein [Chitinimonas sp.]|uniref:ABC transporter substrate-binding protein n=1 Tax=Chitinimonas sp. TaxID=1934313 RepID=UPI0035ADD023